MQLLRWKLESAHRGGSLACLGKYYSNFAGCAESGGTEAVVGRACIPEAQLYLSLVAVGQKHVGVVAEHLATIKTRCGWQPHQMVHAAFCWRPHEYFMRLAEKRPL